MEKEYTKRFHGNPVKIVPLINSKAANKTDKVRIRLKLLNFKKNEKSNVDNPKNIAKKLGIKISAIGIKILKSVSKVRDILIQYKLEKKYPKPKNHPNKK